MSQRENIHLFFNGGVAEVPLLNVCADSWRRCNWNPIRIAAPDNDFLARARSVAVLPRQYYHFASSAVLNNGHFPFALSDPTGFICFHREGFSLAYFAATREWLERADYDVNPMGVTELRRACEFSVRPLMAFASDKEANCFPLLHYAAHTVATIFRAIEAA